MIVEIVDDILLVEKLPRLTKDKPFMTTKAETMIKGKKA